MIDAAMRDPFDDSGNELRPPSWPPASPKRFDPPHPKPSSRWRRIAALGAVLFALLAFLGYLIEPTPEELAAEAAAEEARLAKVNALAEANRAQLALDEERWEAEREEREARPQMNATNFARIREGMTFDEVVAIVGEPSQLLSSSQIGESKAVVYQWKAGFFANAIAMFQDGKMISKAQTGL